MMCRCKRSERGFGLVELTVLIVVVGVLLAVAMQSMTALIESSHRVKTEREMAVLADAIVGDPDITAAGVRSDFGYVGDVGAFPPNLDALTTNPSSYATWEGPYIPAGYSEDTDGFKTDEWGHTYSYSGGTVISSSGGSGTITKQIADATSDYLSNDVSGTIRDANDSLPGTDFVDSVDIVITYPDGTGGTTTDTYAPAADGSFTLAALPAGQHQFLVVYRPDADTLHRYLTVLPRHKSSLDLKFASAHFAAGPGPSPSPGLELVPGSPMATGGGCSTLGFQVTNNGSTDVQVSSLVLSWAPSSGHFGNIQWDGSDVFSASSPRQGSGDHSTFTSTLTVAPGEVVTIQVTNFRRDKNGNCPLSAVSNKTFTGEFSDGSTINFTTGACE